MNMMPSPQSMAPQMPSPDQIERAKAILEAVTWEDIEPVLRTDERRNYNIDIETDSTVFEDAETEKAQRIECVTAVVSMLEKGVPAIQMNPKLAPLMKELGMFTLGAFKIGRTLEETFEETFDQLGNIEPQPNPEAERTKAEMEMAREKHAMEMDKSKAEIASKQQSNAVDMQAKQMDIQFKELSAKLDVALKQMQMAIEREKFGLEKEKMALEGQQAQEQHAIQREEMDLSRQATHEKHHMDREMAVFNQNMKRQEAEDKRQERQRAQRQDGRA